MKVSYLKMILFALFLMGAYSCEKATIDEEIDEIEKPEIEEDDGGGTGTGGGSTGKKDGRDENNPLTVAEFIAGDFSEGVFVRGYIVGACSTNIKHADFEAPFEWSSAILLADEQGETNTDKMISIELKSGSNVRKIFNLKDHPENFGKQAQFFGYHGKYLGIIGIKGPTGYKLFE